MKREAPFHSKTGRLAKLLQVERCTAIGILEGLWHLTAREAAQGNIGKLSNEDIACGVWWSGDADRLVQALIDSRWIDASEEHGLIVHDWPEHADDGVQQKLAKSLLFFADGSTPKLTKLPKSERERIEQEYERLKALKSAGEGNKAPTLPSQALPSLAKPIDKKPSSSPTSGEELPEKPSTPPEPPPSGKPAEPQEPNPLVAEGRLFPDEPPAKQTKEEREKAAKALFREEFQKEFWPVVWLKKDKPDAEKQYVLRRLAGVAKETLVNAAIAQGPHLVAAANSRGNTPVYPATWLHKGRYEEPLEVYEFLLPVVQRSGPSLVPIRDRKAQAMEEFTRRKMQEIEEKQQREELRNVS